MDKKLILEIEKFMVDNQNKINHIIKIHSGMSTNKRNFDRHFTTYITMKFNLEDLGWRFSGARIFFDGSESLYEISMDRIIEFTKIDNKYIFLEEYSQEIFRKSTIEFQGIVK